VSSGLRDKTARAFELDGPVICFFVESICLQTGLADKASVGACLAFFLSFREQSHGRRICARLYDGLAGGRGSNAVLTIPAVVNGSRLAAGTQQLGPGAFCCWLSGHAFPARRITNSAFGLRARRWTAGDRIHECCQRRNCNYKEKQSDQQLAKNKTATSSLTGSVIASHD